MNRFIHSVNRWIPEFLAALRYRFARHLLLLTIAFSIAWATVYVEFQDTDFLLPKVLFVGVLLLPIYFNVFLFTPYLLLRNHTGWYLFFVGLIMCCSIVLAFTAQFMSGRIPPARSLNQESMMTVINAMSAMTSILLIVTGTSSVMLIQQKIRDARRIEELEKTTLQSELEQLNNQINPHFLFNMLNNANVLVGEDPEEAERVLHKLKDLLVYQFDESRKQLVYLKDEMNFLGDFLKLESIRRDRFRYIVLDMECPEDTQVPPLLFIPFVENAVKHGNDSRDESYVLVVFRVNRGELDFMCTNSKPEKTDRKEERGGLGLDNIRRRLDLLYPEKHSLTIHETEKTYTVQIHISL